MSSNFKDRIIESIKPEEVIELCANLIQIPSDNPPGNTVELANFIKEYIEKNGGSVELFEPKEGIVNLVSSIGEGSPHLVLNGHLDQFPAEVGEDWSVDPYGGVIKDSFIYGRGSGDMKGGLASLLYCYVKLLEEDLPGRITFTGTSDEETGGRWGALWLINNNDALLGDAVLNGEPSGLTVRIGEKSRVPLLLRAEGKAAHGSFAGYVGENAILKLVNILPLVDSLNGFEPKLTPSENELTAKVMKGYEQQYGHESRKMSEVLRKVTINIGTIRGGAKDNIIPASCEAEVDIRLPLGITPIEIKEKVEKVAHSKEPSVKVEWNRHPSIITETTYTNEDEAIVSLLSNNSNIQTGEKPDLSFTSGGTDCRFWRNLGVPAVSYGPRVYGMGGVDERIPLEDFLKTAKVHMGTIIDFVDSELI
jgi:succinyl-diaminopimelate desuccinylase